MKIIVQGDLHLRDTPPKRRMDDYYTAQFVALKQLLGWCREEKAALLLSGDLFDRSKPSYALFIQTMELFHEFCDVSVYACLGQHEMPGHSLNIKLSPVYALSESLNNFTLVDGEHSEGGLHISAHHWGQPCILDPSYGNSVNILLGHIPVFKEVPFYWSSEKAYTPNELRETFPGFDYYICGDIHVPLVDDNVVVSGSMMQMNIDQMNFEPRAYLIDTQTKDIKPLYYTTSPDVFSVEEELGTVAEVDMTGLVSSLKQAGKLKDHFKADAMRLAENSKNERTKTIVKEIINERA